MNMRVARLETPHFAPITARRGLAPKSARHKLSLGALRAASRRYGLGVVPWCHQNKRRTSVIALRCLFGAVKIGRLKVGQADVSDRQTHIKPMRRNCAAPEAIAFCGTQSPLIGLCVSDRGSAPLSE